MRTSMLPLAYLWAQGGFHERTTSLRAFCGAKDGVPRRSILVLDPASSTPLDETEAAGFEVTAKHGINDGDLELLLPEHDAVVVRSANRITRSMLTSCPSLAVVGRAGSGVDNIDLVAASELGVPVVNAPTGNARSVAELVLGLMLSVSRSIPQAHGTMSEGRWAKKQFSGNNLGGKILGIVGFGAVGQELAKVAVGIGMTVVIAARGRSSVDGRAMDGSRDGVSRRGHLATEIGVKGPPLPLDELLSVSDFVSLHVPLTPETRQMISGRELGLMKPSAVLVSTARGGVVDEQALLHALEAGNLRGAALDVFEQEKAPLQEHVVRLCRMPNVVCTPHVGGSTKEAGERVLREVCQAIVGVFQGTLSPGRVVSKNPNTSLHCARARSRWEVSP